MATRPPTRYGSSGGARRAGGRIERGGPHRRALARRARRPDTGHGSRLLKVAVVGLLAFVVVTIGGTGLAGVAAVSTVQVLSSSLPDPTDLEELTFSQPTVVYDQSGTVELGRFFREQRRVVSYEEIPRSVLDVTTTAEDRTFWENEGFDFPAILSAIADNASGDRERGASTITQQLVRARLLPEDVVAPGSDRYLRKIKELIQAARVTEAFPGEEGKEQIITAYLNEIFYGQGAYGIAAATRIYFGVTDLSELTIAQAALLAGLPQSPSLLNPYRYAARDEAGQLVVPANSAPVIRRDWILRNLEQSRWTRLSPAELRAALTEPVVLAGTQPMTFKAPHFTWQVRRHLEAVLGSREAVETGGYRAITTLDWEAQELAEKWLAAAAIAPNLPKEEGDTLLDSLGIPEADQRWIKQLRGKDLHNGALVALDYRTGNVLAYVGSAGYYRDDLAGPKFDPKYDAAGDAARQPGSTFKPIVYAAGFEQRALTPGSLLLDITTEFQADPPWAPRNADQLDRGPVLVREALQFSLNIPAVRAMERVGAAPIGELSAALGIRFHGGQRGFDASGLAASIGVVEVRPLDLTAAYGAIGNGGVRVPPRILLEIQDANGNVVWSAGDPEPRQALSAEAAFLVTDVLAGNTDRLQNRFWADKLEVRNGPDGERRPAAVKTGTSNEAKDVSTYGFLAPPEDPDLPALAVGLWMGNSDSSRPDTREPVTSLNSAAPLWRAFVRDYTDGQPVATFRPPEGVVEAAIDAWSGGRPGPWTRSQRTEWFIAGTEPGSPSAIDPDGLLYSRACGGWRVDPAKAELGPEAWVEDVEDWLERARRGAGVEGPLNSKTAYFWGRDSWGGTLLGPCRSGRASPPPPSTGPVEPPATPAPPRRDPPGPPGQDPPGPPGQDPPPPGDEASAITAGLADSPAT